MVTVGEFKESYPEFKDTDFILVQSKIREATARVSEKIFGNSYKYAVMLKTADLLSVSPSGEQAKLRLENRGNMYSVEFAELAHEKSVGAGRVA